MVKGAQSSLESSRWQDLRDLVPGGRSGTELYRSTDAKRGALAAFSHGACGGGFPLCHRMHADDPSIRESWKTRSCSNLSVASS